MVPGQDEGGGVLSCEGGGVFLGSVAERMLLSIAEVSIDETRITGEQVEHVGAMLIIIVALGFVLFVDDSKRGVR